MISKSKAEMSRLESTGKEAIKQAGRDLILNIKNSLTDIFDSIINREVKEAYSEDVLKEVIPSIIKGWMDKGLSEIDVILSQGDLKKLENKLLDDLSNEIKKGITVKAHSGISAGFRIGEKNGDSYYDFTEGGIAESLMEYLNPMLAQIIKESVTKE